MRGRGHVWQRGACVAGGVHGRGWGHGWQGECAWQGEGVCMAGGHVWWGMRGGGCACHAHPPTLQDTVSQCAGSTHPTGMHSCFRFEIASQYLTIVIKMSDGEYVIWAS